MLHNSLPTYETVSTNALSAIVLAVGKTTAAVMAPIGSAIDRMFGMIQELVSSMPQLAEYLGFNPSDLDTVRAMGRTISEVGDTASAMASDISNAGFSFAENFQGLNQTSKDWEVNLKGIADKHDQVVSSIDKIDYKPAIIKSKKLDTTAKATFTSRDRDLQSAMAKAAAKAAGKAENEAARSNRSSTATSGKSKTSKSEVLGPSLEEMMGNQGGDRTIRVQLEGADEFMNSFFEKFLNRAVEDAEAKGILAVRQ